MLHEQLHGNYMLYGSRIKLSDSAFSSFAKTARTAVLIVLNGRNGVTCAVKSGVRCCEKGRKEQRKRVGHAVYFVPMRPPSYIRAAAPTSWSARPYMCERPSPTVFLFYKSRAAIIENDYLRSFYGCFSRVPAFVGIRVK